MSFQTTALTIELDLILPNPEQPRTHIDEEDLQGLAQSICEEGVIQPIVVEQMIPPSGGETGGEIAYILHDGERRWRAARIAGLADIPAVVVDPSDDDDETSQRDRLTRAVVANIQRTDLTPLEIAHAYQKMHDLGLSDQQIADKVGKSRSTVANARRLLELPEEAQDLANQEGVSERIMMALLPIYQMPPEALKLAQDHWNSPRRLLDDIRSGHTNSSDQVRHRARSIICDGTRTLGDAFPADHEFDQSDSIRSSHCDDCPLLIKIGKDKCCPIEACYKAKEQAWQAAVMETASEVYGIPPLPEDADWNEYSNFYGESELTAGIIKKGCENLRLKFIQWAGSSSYKLPDYPQVSVVCYHGTDDDKQCTCLQAARAEHPELVEDPERAERERARAEYQSLIAVCGRVVGAAIEEKNTQIWRWMLDMLPFVDGRNDWDFNQMCQALGERAVDYHTSYDARFDPDLARSEISQAFETLNLTMPDTSPAADIRRRFDRIRGWIDVNVNHITGSDEQPTLEAVQGNLDNLLKLVDEFDAIADQHIDDDRFEGFLVDLAEAVETLNTLRQEMHARRRFPISVGAQTPQEEPHHA